ncbi:anti-phage dCTP deaminase [Thiomonas sp. FB-6]|uniref:anti-phage dCTP deaminase n=1 Tax=Thiomonas sp. FB-6 TaxID=1158291 RepID=UPI000380D9C9|nr:anti-phage dCTP deaminase [Thiomonas sp. FB-6]
MSVPIEQVMNFTRSGNTRELVNSHASKELIFAVVGPVGCGTTSVAEKLEQLAASALHTRHVVRIKASGVIERTLKGDALVDMGRLERARLLQDAGDGLRKTDESAVGALLMAEIKARRADFDEADKVPDGGDVSVLHADKRPETHRVYIIDSLKHPAEVELLRTVYREAFCLVGVVCEEEVRQKRLSSGKCKDSSLMEILQLMKRDEDADEDWGQKVSKTFHQSDFFVDNTPDRMIGGRENPNWVVPDMLGRLLDVLIGEKIVRPLASETGMFHAAGAQLRSACLSRQVGAALTDATGNVIATGTNEVPKAGGGVYGGDFAFERGEASIDERCTTTKQYCSNTRVQAQIMDEVIDAVPQLRDADDRAAIRKALGSTTLGRLLEYSRAVHAEMDAILSATREGNSTVGAKLFVTTFPCHYCARHIVSAGIDEVQFIEPYPKSRAFELHGDAIEKVFSNWYKEPPAKPTKVLFRPFTGVAPRLYVRAFRKNRDLKNKDGQQEVSQPKWAPGLLRMSYLEIEEKVLGENRGC